MSAACTAAMAAIIADKEHRRRMKSLEDVPLCDVDSFEFVWCFCIGFGMMFAAILVANLIMNL